MRFAKKGVIVDTGPLLLLAFYKFRNGVLLPKVRGGIPEQDLEKVVVSVGRFLSSMRNVFTTPYIIAEFHALASSRAKLKGDEMKEFIGEFVEFLGKIDEIYIEKNEILKYEKSWKLCFADTSIILLSITRSIPILTLDKELVGYCHKNNIRALHVYDDIYLNLSLK